MLTRTVTPNGNTSPIDFGVTETVLTSSTTSTADYYFVNGQRVAEQVGSTFSYLIPNLEGSPTVALSSTGSVSAVQLFLPYGAQGFAWGTMPTPHNYTDQLLDSVMGLLYYGARWYDPLADQFVSADSVQGDPSGMNPYGYVAGNPETFVDPTGQRIADICDEDPEDCDTNANSRENQGTIGPYRAPTNGLPPDEGSIPSSAVVVPEVTVALGDTTFTLDEGTNMITEETIGPNGEPEFTTITPNDPNYLATMDEMEALQDGGFPDEGANTTAQGLSDENPSTSPPTTNEDGNSSNTTDNTSTSSTSATSSTSSPGDYMQGDNGPSNYAPSQTTPGTQSLSGVHVNDLGREEPYEAYYDDYGRQIARTDYNAANRAENISEIHTHLRIYNEYYPSGIDLPPDLDHIPGEYDPSFWAFFWLL